jgi:4-hydroxy-tetrahydrodipicolinate reductase
MSYTAVQYGVGPIGRRIVETALARGVEFVGAIDVDPAKVGTDLGRVAGVGRALGCDVTDDAAAALAADPGLVFHATASSVEAVAPQLVEALDSGADVVSTTEELAYPWRTNRAVAERLDAAAREHDATCLGTGINPGFAMDVLPAVLTTPAPEASRRYARRSSVSPSPIRSLVSCEDSVRTKNPISVFHTADLFPR